VHGEGAQLVVVLGDQLAALDPHRSHHPLDPAAVVVDVADPHLVAALGRAPQQVQHVTR
jgi:hypothetical protein